MAREHARIYLSAWDDDDFLALSQVEQWAYWALLSSPDLSWCGVAPLLPQRLAKLSRDGNAADEWQRLWSADAALWQAELDRVRQDARWQRIKRRGAAS